MGLSIEEALDLLRRAHDKTVTVDVGLPEKAEPAVARLADEGYASFGGTLYDMARLADGRWLVSMMSPPNGWVGQVHLDPTAFVAARWWPSRPRDVAATASGIFVSSLLISEGPIAFLFTIIDDPRLSET
ncbi:MAG TPA: hypothetical protein VN238_00945 [Solirubrobacteraceae bacterium]|nr:hypothetical protein [Solirubrobacteraceae bacterium]